ncbi:MAG: hypothetical protein ACRDPM_21395 [Solirubrobacteraceae bacterium]
MSSIPEEAAGGFQRGAADYERGRLLDAVSDRMAHRGLMAEDGPLDTPHRTHVT